MKLPVQFLLPVPRETIELDGEEWEVVTAGEGPASYVVTVKKPGGGNLYYLEMDLENGEPIGSPRKLEIEMLEGSGDRLSGLLRQLRSDTDGGAW